jgi:hypothetical protein
MRRLRGPGVKTKEERFVAKLGDVTDCWIWTGAAEGHGYGQFWSGQRVVLAHRWAYEEIVGVIPSGLELDHLCRNPACVNPAHMEPVTHRENVKRGRAGETVAAINLAKTHCPHGHPYSGSNVARRCGRRHCRECERLRAARNRQRMREAA